MPGVCTVTARRRWLMTPKTQAPRSSSGDDLDQSEILYTRSGRGKGRLAATSSSCLALFVVQLLVEVALIDLEAGNIQRFG